MLRCILSPLIAVLLLVQSAAADPGHPVAVRWWGQGMVSIETMWSFRIVIDPYKLGIGYDDPRLEADLLLVTHEHGDHNNIEIVGGDPIVVRGLKNGTVEEIDYRLDRLPNQDKATWSPWREDQASVSQNAVRVQSIAAWHDDNEGADRGPTAMFVIDVDGVRIVHCGDIGQTALSEAQCEALGRVDVLLIPVGGKNTIDGEQAAKLVQDISPRIVVPVHFKTPSLTIPLATDEQFIDAMKPMAKVTASLGNTLAVSKVSEGSKYDTEVVRLKYEPWKMPAEVAELFTNKDAACRDSRKVFASLSANQLNWSPPNGTHTPRWNAEHMMGRELLFFSQIFNKVDAAIPVMNLNPKQMPPDYKPAHPDWDGVEEARQMERVNAFTRRFSYLLADLPLDQKAPGSFWTPRRLLKQMDRHYGSHTANVQKKFELPDWPEK